VNSQQKVTDLNFRSWKWNIFRVRLILVDAVNGVHEKMMTL